MSIPQNRQPSYHLRPNKAVDRLLFIEKISFLEKIGLRLSDYTYYGFGGPYLEEFRILYEFWPDIKMVSIEKRKEIYKRQCFHRPCRRVRLVHERFSSFLAQYDPQDCKSIFWLDYTGLRYEHFDELQLLLGKVADFSVIKITLECNPKEYHTADNEETQRRIERFSEEFEAVLPRSSATPSWNYEDFAFLLQEMIQVAAEKTLQGLARIYQPISSFCYADGAGMFTFMGIVCPSADQSRVQKAFRKKPFAKVDWSRPYKIALPILSTKERLHIQKRLPRRTNAGRTLSKALGYLIDDNAQKSEEVLKQYADFHRYYPYFVKAIP